MTEEDMWIITRGAQKISSATVERSQCEPTEKAVYCNWFNTVQMLKTEVTMPLKNPSKKPPKKRPKKPPSPPLDTDGKFVVKVVPRQVKIAKDGTVVIDNDKLQKFLKRYPIDNKTHMVVQTWWCGSQCLACPPWDD